MASLVEKLRNHVAVDHQRGCAGRMYRCECGYDAATKRLLREAAARIEELEAYQRGVREHQALKRKDD
jgi:hypothetical protein